jgi:excisionase family DNA binding protein
MTITCLATHPKKFVTVDELALYLELPHRTLYHHIAKGALPALRFGRLIRIPIADARSYAGEPPPPPVPSPLPARSATRASTSPSLHGHH